VHTLWRPLGITDLWWQHQEQRLFVLLSLWLTQYFISVMSRWTLFNLSFLHPYVMRIFGTSFYRPDDLPVVHPPVSKQVDGYLPVPWVPDYRRWWLYDRILYQVNGGRRLGHHCRKYGKVTTDIDFNEDTTNESASVACSNVQLWKLDTQKEWRNTSCIFEMKGLRNILFGFVESKENKWVGS